MPLALLLAMQAAGMVVDWIGTRNQQEMAAMGAQLQQAGIEASIEQTRLETEDASVEALKRLRKTIGSQAALFAARGTKSGAGTALSIVSDTVGNFASDERVRRINQLGKENTLRAGGVISSLNASGEKSKLWQGFAQRTFSNLPVGSLGSLGGGGGGSGAFSGSRASAGRSFGLTQRT